MAEFSPNPTLVPYLNPNHWDGHTLGVGETTGGGEINFDARTSRYARKAMQGEIEGDSIVPLYTFRSGETFKPEEYRPGTIVLFRQETLRGPSVLENYNLDDLVAQERPERTTATSPSFGPNVPRIVADDDRRSYLDHVRWGVVTSGKKGYQLTSTPASSVFEAHAGVRAVMPFISEPKQIVNCYWRDTSLSSPERARERGATAKNQHIAYRYVRKPRKTTAATHPFLILGQTGAGRKHVVRSSQTTRFSYTRSFAMIKQMEEYIARTVRAYDDTATYENSTHLMIPAVELDQFLAMLPPAADKETV